MHWVRITWLIALTLVATTLPASALRVPQRPSKPRVSSAPSKPVHDQKPGTPEQKPAKPADGNPWASAPPDGTPPDSTPPDNAPPGTKAPHHAPSLKIAPNTELWDGGGARAVAASSGTVLIALLLGHDAGSRLVPAPEPTRVRPVDDRVTADSSQGSWLTCRYAHAPPFPA